MSAPDRACRADVRRATAARAGLFLDRDGVVIADTGYPSDPRQVRLIPATVDLIARMNTRDVAVILVTNQSGVGRGYFGWDAFDAVQAEIDARLVRSGARIDAVFACAAHPQAPDSAFRADDHPWRKPNPGMVLAGLAAFSIPASRGWIIGDKPSDLIAGRRAGLAGGTLVGTHDPVEAAALAGGGFRILTGAPAAPDDFPQA